MQPRALRRVQRRVSVRLRAPLARALARDERLSELERAAQVVLLAGLDGRRDDDPQACRVGAALQDREQLGVGRVGLVHAPQADRRAADLLGPAHQQLREPVRDAPRVGVGVEARALVARGGRRERRPPVVDEPVEVRRRRQDLDIVALDEVRAALEDRGDDRAQDRAGGGVRSAQAAVRVDVGDRRVRGRGGGRDVRGDHAKLLALSRVARRSRSATANASESSNSVRLSRTAEPRA